jgi:hypothetical protein
MDPETLNFIAQIFEDHGNTDAGVELIIQRFHNNQELTNWCIRTKAKDVLLAAQRNARKAIETDPSQAQMNAPRTFSRALQESANHRYGRFFYWPLPDGTPLRHATKEQLEAAIRLYKRNAKGNARKMRFVERINERVGRGQRVEDVLTEQEIREISNQTENEQSVL